MVEYGKRGVARAFVAVQLSPPSGPGAAPALARAPRLEVRASDETTGVRRRPVAVSGCPAARSPGPVPDRPRGTTATIGAG